MPLLDFAFLAPLELLYKRLGPEALCSTLQSGSLLPSLLSASFTLRLAVCSHACKNMVSPSQTWDEDTIKSTLLIPERRQKGCLWGKASFSRCKLLDEQDRVLLDLKKYLKHFVQYLRAPSGSVCDREMKRRGELLLSQLFCRAVSDHKHRCQIHDPAEEVPVFPGKRTAKPLLG